MLEKKIVFWGAGSRAEYALEICRGHTLVAVIDNDRERQGKLWHGVPIISFEEYLTWQEKVFVLITPDRRADEIKKVLLENNCHKFVVLNGLLDAWQSEPLDADGEDVDWNLERAKFLGATYRMNWQESVQLLDKAIMLLLYGGSREGVSDFLHIDGRVYTKPVLCASIGNAARFCKALSIIFQASVSNLLVGNLPADCDLLILPDGFSSRSIMKQVALQAVERNIPIISLKDGFLLEICPQDVVESREYKAVHAAIFDSGGYYVNAYVPSRIENILNSEWKMSHMEEIRAKALIDTIIEKRLSKYNHLPPFKPKFSSVRERVVVIDQVYGDSSIKYGMADDEHSFENMLNAALEENPEAQIIVKSHPVRSKGHFAYIADDARIIYMDESVNPISLLIEMDKAYVVTSQMGFEALLCGCEVHTFGMPFYAGWGATHDAVECKRRTRKRSVAEIFYVAYVLSTKYVSYEGNCVCEIEQAIDELLELRDQYWQKK